ncbi:MAG: phosphate ABC transporter substrate-binding protein PstS, partial [bacterium]
MSPVRRLISLSLAATLTLAGCARNEMPGFNQFESDLSGTLNGSGASSMAAGMEAWIAYFQIRHPDVTINYDPTGSGTGRTQFQEGATLFTGSDSYWSEEELAGSFPNCAPGTLPWEFPVWIAPIAIMFNLPGITSLNMSAETVAGIFTGKIKRWDDPAIAIDNPRVDLPNLSITAVHRSDKSGTTGNFTDYLAKTASEIWTAGKTEQWPSEYPGEGFCAMVLKHDE